MKNLIITAILVFHYSITFAAPSITGVTGTLTHKNSLVISGADFGTKSPAAPFKYDNFESGIPGNTVTNGWYTYTQSGGYLPIYSTAQIRHSGTQSAHQRFSGCGSFACNTCYLGINSGLSATTLYVTGWFRYTTAIPSGAAYRNAKLMTVEHEATNWQSRLDITDDGAAQLYAYLGCAQATDVDDYFSLSAAMQNNVNWHRMESTVVITDTANDWRDYKVDLVELGRVDGDFGSTSCYMDLLLLGHYIDSDASTNETTNRYWDEIYIDTTMARVEVGNAATWSGCTHREIQIPSAWSSSSITLTINTGTFAIGQTAYLFVVDSTGAASPGYPVTIGGASAVRPPTLNSATITNGGSIK